MKIRMHIVRSAPFRLRTPLEYFRVSVRRWFAPNHTFDILGFRCARRSHGGPGSEK